MRKRRELKTESRDTFERLQCLVANYLNLELREVTRGASIRDDLGADSLDLIELLMLIDDEFGTDLNEEEAEKSRTVGEIVALIDAQEEA